MPAFGNEGSWNEIIWMGPKVEVSFKIQTSFFVFLD